MSDLHSFDTPDSPPPPAYEISQHEFDQKTSHLLETSASEPQPPEVDLEGFEVWDDATFEAAVRASELSLVDGPLSRQAAYPLEKVAPQPLDDGASSSAIRPLRITKKSTAAPPQKEHPSWYTEAQLDRSSSGSSREPEPPAHAPNTPRYPQPDLPEVSDPCSRESTPPPEFTPVGPSLDGPPYEGIVLTYRPGDDSAPPSPLQSPTMLPQSFDTGSSRSPFQSHLARDLPMPPHSIYGAPTSSFTPHNHQSLPPRRSPMSQNKRPATTYASGAGAAAPLLRFNPQSAYGKKPMVPTPDEQRAPPRVDPAAFYNSAISATLLTNNAGTRPGPLVPNHATSLA
ncbi:hypothetical protein OBBRIDRAFT_196536 [Obba rivulosa]|uniref:Uncharacterized protein n=1 Tax=Obba rivulosa TaxID=1052685 RepID=A0A8E2DR10_9APHY|nr:hypothetical protein OBBRIDRAFT_196536 [Obba rivulosa]